MKRESGRPKQKMGDAFDLSYTPTYKVTEKKMAWSNDIFLTSGRDDDVRTIARSAENLVKRVRGELQRFQTNQSATF